MKKATKLAAMSTHAAYEQAEKLAIAKDQIWSGEGYTKYTFDDNSVLVMSGPTMYALDADSRASIEGYREWLGDDAGFEAADIDRLLEALAE